MIDNLSYFSPQLILASLVLVLMIQTSIRRSETAAQMICLTGLFLAIAATLHFTPSTRLLVTELVVIQPLSQFLNFLILLSALSSVLLQTRYSTRSREVQDEFYMLISLATLGACILTTANHGATLVLGLELMSLSILAMIGYQRQRHLALEASLKFLILSGSASAFLLFGMALLYAGTGSLLLPELMQVSQNAPNLLLLTQIGMVMVIIGLGFKLSLIPFHWWTPDVYQGAPVNSTLFLATVSKTAVFGVLLHLLLLVSGPVTESLIAVLSGVAIISMLGGNLLALQQANLKRLFAYSAIAHMGYVLVAAILGIQVNNSMALEGSSYYLLAYVLASIAIFSVLTMLSNITKDSDFEQIDEVRGLFWTHPWLATTLLFATLSMAGMPLTVGFIGKFYLLAMAVEHSAWWLISAMIVGSVIGLYYYLRVIFSLFAQSEQVLPNSSVITRTWVGFIALGILILGVLPGTLGGHIAALFT